MTKIDTGKGLAHPGEDAGTAALSRTACSTEPPAASRPSGVTIGLRLGYAARGSAEPNARGGFARRLRRLRGSLLRPEGLGSALAFWRGLTAPRESPAPCAAIVLILATLGHDRADPNGILSLYESYGGMRWLASVKDPQFPQF